MSNPHDTTAGGKVQKRKRVRPLPAHVNARNLATEKRKRCEMKENIIDLARLVPSLANARRLNKVLIVNESIKHFRTQRDMCLDAAEDMQDLIAENRRFAAEINAMRAQTGLPLVEPRPVSEAMTQLMSVKDEVYGVFNNGFGDNWAAEADENQRSRSGTADHDLQLGLFPPGEQTYLAQLSPPDELTLGNEIPFTMPPPPFSAQPELPWGLPTTDLPGQVPPVPGLDMYGSTTAPEGQPLVEAAYPTTFDVLSPSWTQGVDMGVAHAIPYMAHGNEEHEAFALSQP
ncbi:hypothetical protein CGLO_05265 [Colletotrichum gloeosporioides Cg-14]|uniref:BHLH domain-containing protein n=1 Tax=Colletotrichum gloeosporioides (strain Cg-14) TaxID=1237896 RepID=T0LSZ7_COLGC|nr:hypothetical protein CGLO_05265 [Colletotrichum gloeosporioides Cg-14]